MTSSFFGMEDFVRGKYHWAEIAQPDGSKKLYRRATTVAGYLDDLNGLIEWKQAMTAVGVARSKSLQANLSFVDWYTDKAKTKDLTKKAFVLGGGEEAADTGTAFHAMIELHEGGTDPQPGVELPEGFAEAFEAYKAFKAAHGITTVGSEVKVIDDANEVAGTADLIYTFDKDVKTPFGVIEAGDGIIADVKTGSVSDLSGMKMGMQLGIYAHGDLYDVNKAERVKWPVEMNSSIGLILKVDLKTGEVIPWWLNLAEAYRYVSLAMQVWEARKAGKGLIAQATFDSAGAPSAGEKLGAREVGKLITAATTWTELNEIKEQHGNVFTETMTKRWNEKYNSIEDEREAISEGVKVKAEEPADEFSDLKQEASDLIMAANKALGAATTVEELKAAWKAHSAVMTDEQKEFAKSQAAKLKAIEEAHAAKAAEPEPEAPAAGNETQVSMPDWDLEGESEDEIVAFSVEDAKARAAATANKGELKELWREFNRAVKSGKSTPEALKVITDRAAEF